MHSQFQPDDSGLRPAACVPQEAERLVCGLDLKRPTEKAGGANATGRPSNYYEILGVDRLASSRDVERAFLQKCRQHLAKYKEHGAVLPIKARAELVTLYVARDILLNALVREDHDFEMLSLKRQHSKPRGTVALQDYTDVTDGEVAEALSMTGVLSPAALQTALSAFDSDLPISFPRFLIQANLISQEEFEAALLGRLMVKRRKLRRKSLKRVFRAMKMFGVDFVQSILVTVDTTGEELLAMAKSAKLAVMAEKITNRLNGAQASV